jgi:hypothetical protein
MMTRFFDRFRHCTAYPPDQAVAIGADLRRRAQIAIPLDDYEAIVAHFRRLRAGSPDAAIELEAFADRFLERIDRR